MVGLCSEFYSVLYRKSSGSMIECQDNFENHLKSASFPKFFAFEVEVC